MSSERHSHKTSTVPKSFRRQSILFLMFYIVLQTHTQARPLSYSTLVLGSNSQTWHESHSSYIRRESPKYRIAYWGHKEWRHIHTRRGIDARRWWQNFDLQATCDCTSILLSANPHSSNTCVNLGSTKYTSKKRLHQPSHLWAWRDWSWVWGSATLKLVCGGQLSRQLNFSAGSCESQIHSLIKVLRYYN